MPSMIHPVSTSNENSPLTPAFRALTLIVEDQGYIGAGPDTGEGDDLVSALVLAHWAWVEPMYGFRTGLAARNMTWDSVKGERPPHTPADVFSHAFQNFFQNLNRRQREHRERF